MSNNKTNHENKINKYHFAVYFDAILKIDNEDEKIKDMVFFEKQFFCAHITKSSYDNHNNSSMGISGELQELASIALCCSEDEMKENEEYIEDLSECQFVCFDPETDKEMNAYDFLEENKYKYVYFGSNDSRFANWCDYSN